MSVGHSVEHDVRAALDLASTSVRSRRRDRSFQRELHEHLMAGVRGERGTPGEFRRRQNHIGAPGSPLDAATFVPPPVAEMEEALDDLERYLNADDLVPPLIRLALSHYQFEAIHPFEDGNGRIGRLLISLLLVHWKLLPSPLLYLSAFLERNRNGYYKLLLAVTERGVWSEWVIFFLRGVEEQARDAVARAKQLQDLERHWRQQVAQARSSGLLLRLVESLFDTPIVTIPRVQRLLDVTYRAAAQNVQKLVEAGILHPVGGRSYGKLFAARDILRVVDPGGRASDA
ncbi:MAG TPA: Fic family protein [Chloroflexota bacterium]|nr:Fic family protein [Chloroflexota bacterium]